MSKSDDGLYQNIHPGRVLDLLNNLFGEFSLDQRIYDFVRMI
jgi:hypothetical protein